MQATHDAAGADATGRGSLLRDLVALTKPRITLMVLITTAGGLWLAPGEMTLLAIAATLIGTAAVVSSANALNCWMERDSDKHMARTKRRPLPAGRMEPHVALRFGLALGAFSVPLLALAVNPLTGLLAAIALVSYVWIYTPMKQVSPAALLVGSVPGAMPPLMGWTAATGSLEAPGIVLFGILFLWQLPHFLAIAMFRQGEYTRAGIKVMPAVRGVARTKLHAAMYAGALVPVSLMLVPLGIAGAIYLTVVGLAGVVFAVMCIRGLRIAEQDREASHRWARAVFFASLVYLPLLFAALAIDVAAR
ncbi:heme o synthase [Sandaracinus amylolyticus]|uniref:Protoheme IX farnesyltransferase n=1 Tax=Sandaracinus amylolyticus TaxID=927083 RepID=A0A0F6YMY4_9BACT|nr:heme o synthase [Sandaracinus amylolyticus]AKF10682.1 Heme O synthase, protoheme IX farnesyltransferase [Sandaracinus amylolyticus]